MNADGLRRYLVEMPTTEGMGGPIPTFGAVWLEIRFLPQAISKLDEEAEQIQDLDTAIKVLNVTGLASMRVVKLVEIQRSLSA